MQNKIMDCSESFMGIGLQEGSFFERILHNNIFHEILLSSNSMNCISADRYFFEEELRDGK
jgi:hypothetical protein